MAYGATADSLDEYLKMSERTARECLYRFSKGVVKLFHSIYLRKHSLSDVQKLFAAHEERHGFPGMLGSVDCTHWIGETVHNLGEGCIPEGIMEHHRWYWKPLLLKICGFDMLSLGLLDPTTTSMYSINPQYSMTC